VRFGQVDSSRRLHLASGILSQSLTESEHAFHPPLPFPTAVHGIGYELRGRLDSRLFGIVRFSDNRRLTLPR